jgi:hypothetical protein
MNQARQGRLWWPRPWLNATNSWQTRARLEQAQAVYKRFYDKHHCD